jgi:NifU-like protein
MAKGDLIGGTLWDQYSNKVAERMNNPKYLGEISPEEAEALGAELVVADHGAESCGDAVRLYWAVHKKSGKIVKASFKSFGCGTAIASSDMMAELCVGKTVDEAVKITNIDVESAMRDTPDVPAVPPQKMHCSVMAYDVIKAAAAKFKCVDLSSLEEEEIVCECARVSLGTIQEVIRLNDLKSVEEITAYTKAGAFCKSCLRPGGHETRKYYLTDILKETRAKMESESIMKRQVPYAELSPFKQARAVETLFDAEIRPALMADGGNVEIVDLTMGEAGPLIQIRYEGACISCPASGVGTLDFIGRILKEKLDRTFTVEIL